MEKDPLHIKKELFGRIADGEEKAFAEIFNLYTDRLYAYTSKITKSDTWAEEIVQDVWMQVWLHRAELAGMEHPEAYLFRIARNRSLDWMRRNKIQLKWQYYLTLHFAGDSRDLTVGTIEYKQTARLLHEAIEQLPPQRKHIFELKNQSGFSYDQIAEKLQISKNTVRNQMVSALHAIRAHLLKNGNMVLFLSCLLFYFDLFLHGQ